MPTTIRAFEVHENQQEFRIRAAPERVWTAFVEETNSWWHRDFYTGRDPRAFHIEARLGGLMWEDWGDGQGLAWATVIGVRRAEFLQVKGILDTQFGGPAGLITTWRFEASEGGTLLRFHDSSWGAAGEATRKSLDVGWRFLLGRCLKNWIEKGERVTDPAPTS